MYGVKSVLLQSGASFITLQKQLKSAQNRFIALQAFRTAHEAYNLHLQYAHPGDFLPPMAGLRAARIVLKAVNRRLKGRSDSFYWRWGAPKRCLMRCRPSFRSVPTADKSNDAKVSRTMLFLVRGTHNTHSHTRAFLPWTNLHTP